MSNPPCNPCNLVGLPSSSVTSEEEDPTGSEAAAAAPLLTGSLGRQRRVSFREAKNNGRGGRDGFEGGGGGGGPEQECPHCRLQCYGGEVGGGGAEYRDGRAISI